MDTNELQNPTAKPDIAPRVSTGSKNGRKGLLLYAILGLSLLAIPIWALVLEPYFTKIPRNFTYRADVSSLDNFYDEIKQEYSGEKRSVTKFSYEVTGEKDGKLLIKNIFDVSTLTGEKIFSVDRLYGIDPLTREHVLGYGDRDRDGYLLAPHHLAHGKSFTYWHINYDGPAHMIFKAEENISGLVVYHYETRYEGVKIDQTENLGFLPGVGVTRGVELEPHLELWVEPVSGHVVKYKDDTIAYYYDLATGKRQNPWNHFSNAYTSQSVVDHVALAKQEKLHFILLRYLVPSILLIVALALILYVISERIGKWTWLIAIIFIFALLGWGVWLVYTPATPQIPGTVEKIRVGVLSFPAGSSAFVAQANGYFRDEGLSVEMETFDSGKMALAAMLQDSELRIVTVAQTPVVVSGFDRSDLAIISGILVSDNDSKILARNDRGITRAEDLKGKTVGIVKGTTGHYFLDLFLAEHGLNFTDIKTVDLPAAGQPEALVSGSVDAIASWEPHIYQAQEALGTSHTTLQGQGILRTDFYLVTFKDWAHNNQQTLEKYLRAIDRANEYMKQYPEEAQQIIAAQTSLDPQFIKSVWGDYNFALFLDQSILLSLEQQARWTKTQGIVVGTTTPDYLDLVYFDALESVKETAVTIIH